MKRNLLSFALCICFAGNLPAEDSLVSRPIGIVQLQIGPQSSSMASMPLVPFSNSLESVLTGLVGSTNEATADRICKWDAVIQEYRRAFKLEGSGSTNLDGRWFSDFATLSNSDLTLSPGEGFFIDNRQSVNQQVYLSGKILLDATNEMILYPGLNLVGTPFAGAGSSPMGQGRWEANTSGAIRVFLETRPYCADVFPPEGPLPAITGIKITSTGDITCASLSIQCAGTMLDVFYKDLTSTNVFESDRGWKIAGSNILVSGWNTIEWTDQGGDSRPPISEVFARFFLIGTDLDQDHNGIPDAREMFVYGTRKLQISADFTSFSSNLAESVEQRGVGTNTLTGITNAPPFIPAVILGRIIYVDRAIGCDTFSGKSPVIVGQDGPKSSIKAGLAAVGAAGESGGILIIKSGMYGTDLNIAGKENVSVVIDGDVDLTRGSPESTPLIQQPKTNVSGVATNGL